MLSQMVDDQIEKLDLIGAQISRGIRGSVSIFDVLGPDVTFAASLSGRLKGFIIEGHRFVLRRRQRYQSAAEEGKGSFLPVRFEPEGESESEAVYAQVWAASRLMSR